MIGELGTSAGFAFEEATYEAGGRYGPLVGCRAILIMLNEGQALVETGEGSTLLSARQCGLFVGREGVGLTFPAGLRTRAVLCLDKTAPFDPTEQDGTAGAVETTDPISKLLQLGLDVGRADSPSSNRLRDAIGAAAFSAYLAGSERQADASIPNIVLRARDYVRRHFSEPCDLGRLANEVGVTREHLVSAFRKHLGITPVRYLWELRTERAIHLVRATNLRLEDIAHQCGYKSQYHLSREIKKMCGISPRSLRQGHLGSSFIA